MLLTSSHGFLMDNSNVALLENPNLVVHYLSKENFDRLEVYHNLKNKGRLQRTDFSSVSFLLYTSERGSKDPLRFDATTEPQKLVDHGFNTSRETKILVHGWNSQHTTFSDIVDGKETIIMPIYFD